MRTVLIADDERSFLLSLSDGLGAYADEFAVVTAENGKSAVGVLESRPVDLVVTDLKMPEMDGFELLAYLTRHRPEIPVVVMTAYGTPEIERQLNAFGVFRYVEKPLDFRELAERIREELAPSAEGHVQGIALATFMQLVEMEKKTCTLAVTAGAKKGVVYFFKGELMGAETGSLTGESAAHDIVSWDGAEIAMERVCRKKEKTIDVPLNHVLMESLRLKDERRRAEREERELREPTGGAAPPDRAAPSHAINGAREVAKVDLKVQTLRALERHLTALKEIKGYRAAGVLSGSGEALVADSTDSAVDLTEAGAALNGVLCLAHESAGSVLLEGCREVVLATPHTLVMLRCSGPDARAHFHLVGVVASETAEAAMRMQHLRMKLDKLAALVSGELAG